MNVTTLAHRLGYRFPPGWTVEATTEPDIDTRPTDVDCYDQSHRDAWARGDWRFVCLLVRVVDPADREWGRDILGGCEHGDLPGADHTVDPLADPGGYLPDLIEQACLAAIGNADRCGAL